MRFSPHQHVFFFFDFEFFFFFLDCALLEDCSFCVPISSMGTSLCWVLMHFFLTSDTRACLPSLQNSEFLFV